MGGPDEFDRYEDDPWKQQQSSGPVINFERKRSNCPFVFPISVAHNKKSPYNNLFGNVTILPTKL